MTGSREALLLLAKTNPEAVVEMSRALKDQGQGLTRQLTEL